MDGQPMFQNYYQGLKNRKDGTGFYVHGWDEAAQQLIKIPAPPKRTFDNKKSNVKKKAESADPRIGRVPRESIRQEVRQEVGGNGWDPDFDNAPVYALVIVM